MTERLNGFFYAGISLRFGRKVLLLKNAKRGTWELPGGTVDKSDQSYLQAAKREFHEETSLDITGSPQWCLGTAPKETPGAGITFGFALDTSAGVPPKPTLSDEHSEYGWWPINELPEDLHEVCRPAIERWEFNEADLQRLLVDGTLIGPNSYFSQVLMPVRITGTGLAMRVEKMQFTFRDTKDYLNDDFLKRCNGLPLLWQHADKDFTDGDTLGAQSIGLVTDAYIRGTDVWGVAKILDLDAATAMATGAYSTSPSFITHIDSQSSSGGVDVTVEGQVLHLDHLAVVQAGVWDKLGEPCGIDTPITLRPIPLNFLKEYNPMSESGKPAAEKEVDKVTTEAAANADAATDVTKATETALADALTQLSELKAQVKGLLEKEQIANQDAATEQTPEEEVADPSNGDQAPLPGETTTPSVDAAAFETAMAAKDAVIESLQKQVDGLVQSMPKDLSDEDRNELDAACSRVDSIFMALGKTAPHPLNGEGPMQYRRRTTKMLQPLSNRFGKMDLSKLDQHSYDTIEAEIYKDAQSASRSTTDLTPGEVRAVRRKSFGGREIIEYRGSPKAFLAPFSEPPKKARAGLAHTRA